MTKLSDGILLLHAKGMSYEQIKTELNCSKGTIAYHLGAGQKEKTLIRQRDKRNKIIRYVQEVKQGAVCVDCKEDYPYWMMDFDHLYDKSFNLASGKYKSLESVKNEISKCDLVCANCHRNRTHHRLLVSGSDTLDLSNIYGE